MKRSTVVLFLVPMLLAAWVSDSDARRRRRRRRRRPRPAAGQTSPQAAKAIAALVGKYKWNLTPNQVIRLLTVNLKKTYNAKIRKAQGHPLRQDRLRRDLAAEIRKIKRSYVKFDGHRTNWDSSIVDDQFGHNNGESMLVYLEKEQQRFFFFHNGRLYKQFIAFNADHPNYKGLTFPQFLGKLIQAFGQGKPVFQKDVAGQSRLHHVEWIGANNVHMWAVDKSTIYGNFCVVLFDNTMRQSVLSGRRMTGASRPRSADDALIDSVTKPRREDEY